MNIDEVLDERATTHGDYAVHARVTQDLKNVVRSEPTYTRLNACEREALDMILHKIGRIIAGNPSFTDHWVDISGYATLVPRHAEP